MNGIRWTWPVCVVVASLLITFAPLLITSCDTAPPPKGMLSGPGATKAKGAEYQDQGETPQQQISQTTSDDAQGSEYEHLDPGHFSCSTIINNEWFPLEPGTQFVWTGITVDDEGEEQPHRVVFTVTDLTKEIDGVDTVVCWDQDFVDDELQESEMVFIAQDDDGTVWQMGQYLEEYDECEFVAAPCWIHGINDGKAGIIMLSAPELGTTSYSERWAPTVVWTDRGVVYQVGQETTVPFGAFEDVLVIHDSNKEESGACQLKYYARGVGHVRVGWRGEPTDRMVLGLTQVEQLSAEQLAEARYEALTLEAYAYQRSEDVFAQTKRSEYSGPDEIELPSIELPKEVVHSNTPKRRITDEQAKGIALNK